MQALKEHDPVRVFPKSFLVPAVERIAAEYSVNTLSEVISPLIEESVPGDRLNVQNGQV